MTMTLSQTALAERLKKRRAWVRRQGKKVLGKPTGKGAKPETWLRVNHKDGQLQHYKRA